MTNDDTVSLYLAEGDNIDGGPFVNARVTHVEPGGEKITVRQRGDVEREETVTASEIQDALTDEINDSQPIRISGTGPKHSPETAKVTLPLRAGFVLEAWGGDVPMYDPEDDGRDRYHNVTRSVGKHGGMLVPA